MAPWKNNPPLITSEGSQWLW